MAVRDLTKPFPRLPFAILLGLTVAMTTWLVLWIVWGSTTPFPPCPESTGCLWFQTLAVITGHITGLSGAAFTILTWPVMLGTTAIAWRRYQNNPWIARPLFLATLLMGFVVLLILLLPSNAGAAFPRPLFLGSLLLIQGLIVLAGWVSLNRAVYPELPHRLHLDTPLVRASIGTLGLVFLSMLTGVSNSLAGGIDTCAAWPLCGGDVLPANPAGWIALLHRVVAGLAAFGVIHIVVKVWKYQRQQTSILVLSSAAGVLYLSQGMIGALRVLQGEPTDLIALHSLTATALWAVLVILLVQAALAVPAHRRVDLEQVAQAGIGQRLRDFLALTKPIIVGLLLFTTYGGMVVAGGRLPEAGLTFWVLLGGALAAGGSSAINQYVDRHLDRLMARTARRPLAAGRLHPSEGLAFGVALCLLSFYLLAGFVNLTAALLSVSGMLYYVVLYSLLLKKTTVQNIVIGGGAGAIPPLVGWAAVNGALSWPALLLFGVIFFWTPPHFWALALVRRNDYKRAGVPMLPVVRGELETRRQILIYTLELVAITLLLPFFGLGGAPYFVIAVGLGAWLLRAAWLVWKRGGNKVAWKMYRHSSMYLAFIFLALMVDALI